MWYSWRLYTETVSKQTCPVPQKRIKEICPSMSIRSGEAGSPRLNNTEKKRFRNRSATRNRPEEDPSMFPSPLSIPPTRLEPGPSLSRNHEYHLVCSTSIESKSNVFQPPILPFSTKNKKRNQRVKMFLSQPNSDNHAHRWVIMRIKDKENADLRSCTKGIEKKIVVQITPRRLLQCFFMLFLFFSSVCIFYFRGVICVHGHGMYMLTMANEAQLSWSLQSTYCGYRRFCCSSRFRSSRNLAASVPSSGWTASLNHGWLRACFAVMRCAGS